MSWILNQQKLHITIGSSPQTTITGQTSKIDLKNDVEMVTAALLYADSAKLCSPTSSALLDVLDLTDPPEEERLELLRKFRSWGFLDQDTEKKLEVIFEFYERARRRRHSRKGQTLLREFNNALDEVWHELILETSKIMSEIGVDGIAQARESGLLEIYTFESLVERILKAEDYEEFTWEYVNTVSAAVSDSHTYPLFDEDTGNIISAGIAAGKITVSTSGISRSREVATVKEILDIRRELDKPLRRFRAA